MVSKFKTKFPLKHSKGKNTISISDTGTFGYLSGKRTWASLIEHRQKIISY